MVRDGYLYGIASICAALLFGWLLGGPYSAPVLLLGCFFLWFFRDPERQIPQTAGTMVSPADGKVTEISQVNVAGNQYTRISIFLSVFDVHVNRSPIAGVIRDIRYQRGKFLDARNPGSADQNEQNIVAVEGDGQTVIFKQIAGLLARRIVFTPKVGDKIERGQRVGLIKFGSRVDVLFTPEAAVQVKLGEHVKGGETVLALLPVSKAAESNLVGAREAQS
jgi:phosphatidylserine decarboxylase